MMQRLMSALILSVFGSLIGCATGGNGTGATKGALGASDPRKQVYLTGIQGHSPRLESQRSSCPSADKQLDGQSWQRLMGYADACVVAKNYAQTEKLANLMATHDPLSPWGPYFLGLVAEAQNDFPRALWMIELALKKAPQSGLIQYQQGRLLFALDDIAGSVRAFRQAVQLDPELTEANLALGHILFREQYWSEALPYLEKGLEKDRKNVLALIAAAECHLQKSDFKIAAEYLDRAQDLDPRRSSVRLRLAEVQEEKLKEYGKALSSYKDLRSMALRKRLDQTVSVDLDSRIKHLEQLVAKLEKAEAQRNPTSQSDAQRRVTK